ncbi:nitrite reductase [Streptomyces sp. SID14478]|uniref:(2Fe-2S)-binding protein n=1 Tax=Streptomyces sp. SID14478 TaxID=2706073 RepID=UPI0013DD6C56|nr:nitrite reductase [Streptomyces sp. SID14478]
MTSYTSEDPVICLCADVRESEVLSAIAAGICDIPTLRETTSANTGCGDCIIDLEELLEAREDHHERR